MMSVRLRRPWSGKATTRAILPRVPDAHEDSAGLFARYARSGDADALAAVFDHCAPRLLSVAIRLSRDANEAEDIVQDTFLFAMERAADFRADSPLMPWLLAILTNRARAARRLRGRQRSVGVERADAVQPSDVALHLEASREVACAVERLAQPYREVIILHLQHGLSPVQVARALARPAGTVRSQIARGLAMLREKLPPGLVGGFVATPGLAAVRGAVLKSAVSASSQPLSLAGLLASTLSGILAMKKLFVLSAALVLLALWGWSATGVDGAPTPGDSSLEEERVAAAEDRADESRTEHVDRSIAADPESESRRPRLFARLVDDRGRAVPNVEVGFVAGETLDVDAEAPRVAGDRAVSTGPDGEFVLAVAPRTTGFLVLADRSLGFQDGGIQGSDGQHLRFHGLVGDLDLGNLIVIRSPRVIGKVSDEAGSPIRDAMIRCVPTARPSAGFLARYGTRTDADGRFEVGFIGPGSYVLSVRARGFRSASVAMFLVGASKRTENVTLRSGFVSEGRVVNDLLQPIEGARVLPIRGQSLGAVQVQVPSEVESVSTDADGRFRLSGLRRDETGVHVLAPGHIEARIWALDDSRQVVLQRKARIRGRVTGVEGRPLRGEVLQFGGSSSRCDAEGRFEITANPGRGDLVVLGQVVTTRVVLPGETVELGEVSVAAPLGIRVSVTRRGSPVAGAEVTAHGWPQNNGSDLPWPEVQGRANLGAAEVRAVTDTSGRATLVGVDAGRHVVRVSHRDYLTKRLAAVVDERDGANVSAELSGGSRAVIEVRRADGSVVRGREVVLVEKIGPSRDGSSFRGVSGHDGMAEFGPVRAGNYEARVFVDQIEYAFFGAVISVGSAPAVLARQSIDVRKGSSARATLVLPPQGELVGVVRTESGVVVGARVTLAVENDSRNDGPDHLVTKHCDGRGRFRFRDVPPGRHALLYSSHGAISSTRRFVVVTSGAPTEVECLLEEATLNLRVVRGVDGTPVPDVRLRLHPAESFGLHLPRVLTKVGGFHGLVEAQENIGVLRSNHDGRVACRNVPVGSYTLRVDPSEDLASGGFLGRELRIDVPRSGLDLGDIRLELASRILGTVVDREGQPVNDAQLYRRLVGAEPSRWIPLVARDGKFDLKNLPAGRHEIRAAAPSSGKPTVFGEIVRVNLAAGGSRRIVVRLP